MNHVLGEKFTDSPFNSLREEQSNHWRLSIVMLVERLVPNRSVVANIS